MVSIVDFIIAVAIGTIVLIILYKIRQRELIEPFSLLSTIIESYFSGFTIYMGIGAVYYSFGGDFPFHLTTVVNVQLVMFFGGLSLIAITGIGLFRKEISRRNNRFLSTDGQNEISMERINFCYYYHRYKQEAKESELKVIKIFKDKTLQVSTTQTHIYLNKVLYFDLLHNSEMPIDGSILEVPSQPLAICQLITASEISTFRIVKWLKKREYASVIKALKTNNSEIVGKSILKLRCDPVADQYRYIDLKKTKEGIDNINRSRGVN